MMSVHVKTKRERFVLALAEKAKGFSFIRE